VPEPVATAKTDRSLPPEFEAARPAVAQRLHADGISLALLHGSRARGRGHPGSDLDVAVLAADGRPLSYAAMGLLALDLSGLLGHRVDISDLATPDAVFRFEVARSARILYEARRGAFTDFLAKALIDHADIERFLPALVAGVARRAQRDAQSAARGRE
jgi:predicted nucleotidyltransferase